MNGMSLRPRPALQLSRPRVLYVEDVEDNFELAKIRLRKAFELVWARDDRAAFEALASGPFLAVLMDVELQGARLDGVAITRVLRGLDAAPVDANREGTLFDGPIVFVSGYSSPADQMLLESVSGQRAFAKPVDFAALASLLTSFGAPPDGR